MHQQVDLKPKCVIVIDQYNSGYLLNSCIYPFSIYVKPEGLSMFFWEVLF
jgi:hypothetical protein